eukprot:Gb_01682 [translate_table: standard]
MASSRRESFFASRRFSGKSGSNSSPRDAFTSSSAAQLASKVNNEAEKDGSNRRPLASNNIALSRDKNPQAHRERSLSSLQTSSNPGRGIKPDSYRGGSSFSSENNSVVARDTKSHSHRGGSLSSFGSRGVVARDTKCQCHRGESSNSSENSSVLAKETKSQYHKGGMPRLSDSSSGLARESSSHSDGVRHSQFLDNSRASKGKAHTKSMTNHKRLKRETNGPILAKAEKQHVRQHSKVTGDSDGIAPLNLSSTSSDWIVMDDEFESDFVTSGAYEEALLDFNLLPDELLSDGQVICSDFTPEKMDTGTIGGFCNFDGSRFSPIEEALLVLNRPTAHLHAYVIQKETGSTLQNVEVVESQQIGCAPGDNVTEKLEIHNVKVDSVHALQPGATQYYPVINPPLLIDDMQTTWAENPSEDIIFTEKACENPSIGSDLPSCRRTHSPQHPECDSVVSSISALDLEELDLGKSSHVFKKEANRVADELVASATNGMKELTPEASIRYCTPTIHEDEETPKCISLNFPFDLSLIHFDAEFAQEDSEISHEFSGCSNQEPLFWPLNPNSYWYDNAAADNEIQSSLCKVDSKDKLKAEKKRAVLTKSTDSSLSCKLQLQGGLQSSSGRKLSTRPSGSMSQRKATKFLCNSSERVASRYQAEFLLDPSKRESTLPSMSILKSKSKSAGQSRSANVLFSKDKTNDTKKEASPFPRISNLSREPKIQSQSVPSRVKLSQLNYSGVLSSDKAVSTIGNGMSVISPSGLLADNTTGSYDEKCCSHFGKLDTKSTKEEDSVVSALSMEHFCDQIDDETQGGLSKPFETDCHSSLCNFVCNTKHDTLQMLDKYRFSNSLESLEYDLIAADCEHATELKDGGNYNCYVGGSGSLFSCKASSIRGSDGHGISVNDGLNLTTDQMFWNCPDSETGHFGRDEHSIEVLVGMKEFDGNEGIGEVTLSLCESGVTGAFSSYADWDSVQCDIVQNNLDNAEESDISVSFQIPRSSAVVGNDTGSNILLSSHTEKFLSSVSSLVLPEAAAEATFGTSTIFKQAKGMCSACSRCQCGPPTRKSDLQIWKTGCQAPEPKGGWIQDFKQTKCGSGINPAQGGNVLSRTDVDWQSDRRLSRINLPGNIRNLRGEDLSPRRLSLQNSRAEYNLKCVDQSLVFSELLSCPQEQKGKRGKLPVLATCQIAGKNQFYVLQEEYSVRENSQEERKWESLSSIGSSRQESDDTNQRSEESLLEWRQGNNNNICRVIGASGLMTGISGNYMSEHQQLYCAGGTFKHSRPSRMSETSVMHAFQNWIEPGQAEGSNLFKCESSNWLSASIHERPGEIGFSLVPYLSESTLSALYERSDNEQVSASDISSVHMVCISPTSVKNNVDSVVEGSTSIKCGSLLKGEHSTIVDSTSMQIRECINWSPYGTEIHFRKLQKLWTKGQECIPWNLGVKTIKLGEALQAHVTRTRTVVNFPAVSLSIYRNPLWSDDCSLYEDLGRYSIEWYNKQAVKYQGENKLDTTTEMQDCRYAFLSNSSMKKKCNLTMWNNDHCIAQESCLREIHLLDEASLQLENNEICNGELHFSSANVKQPTKSSLSTLSTYQKLDQQRPEVQKIECSQTVNCKGTTILTECCEPSHPFNLGEGVLDSYKVAESKNDENGKSSKSSRRNNDFQDQVGTAFYSILAAAGLAESGFLYEPSQYVIDNRDIEMHCFGEIVSKGNDIIDDDCFELGNVPSDLSVGYTQHVDSHISDLSGNSSELLDEFSSSDFIEIPEDQLSCPFTLKSEFDSEVNSLCIPGACRTLLRTLYDECNTGLLLDTPVLDGYLSGISDANWINCILEENFEGMMKYASSNIKNLIQESSNKDSVLYVPLGLREFQGLQKSTKNRSEENTKPDLPNIVHEDCKFVTGERLESTKKQAYLLRKRRGKEATSSCLAGKALHRRKSSQDDSFILEEIVSRTDAEEIKTVTHIHHNDNPSSDRRSKSVTTLPEADEDLLSAWLFLLLQLQIKSKTSQFNTQDTNMLAESEVVRIKRKLEAMEVEQQNKKLERLLKCMLRTMKRLQQSLQGRNLCWSSRKALVCKFPMPSRKRMQTGLMSERIVDMGFARKPKGI